MSYFLGILSESFRCHDFVLLTLSPRFDLLVCIHHDNSIKSIKAKYPQMACSLELVFFSSHFDFILSSEFIHTAVTFFSIQAAVQPTTLFKLTSSRETSNDKLSHLVLSNTSPMQNNCKHFIRIVCILQAYAEFR